MGSGLSGAGASWSGTSWLSQRQQIGVLKMAAVVIVIPHTMIRGPGRWMDGFETLVLFVL
jgi:hypothetical protein